MEFQLTKELIDQIMFGMENQEDDFVLDSTTAQVVRMRESEEDSGDERYVPLPEWRSVDGYNLMERFVASLHNPIYRESLRRILASGKGVFRQFKDALKDKKEIERLWFNFKEREMRSLVVEWYNTLRDSWGLERIGEPDGDETEALLLSDFTIQTLSPDTEVMLAFDSEHTDRPTRGAASAIILHFARVAFQECFPGYSAALVDFLFLRRNRLQPDPASVQASIAGMFTPTGELAGFIWGADEELADRTLVNTVGGLYVLPAYRGLGLAETLFNRYCEEAYGRQVSVMIMELPGNSSVLRQMLDRAGVKAISESFQLDMVSWYHENHEIP